jgi:hypothetical protein
VGGWVPNAVGLLVGSVVVAMWSLALLWRVGSWHISTAATLTHDEGLRLGSRAPEVACHTPTGADRHLSFGGRSAFVVFGSGACVHCVPLLSAAQRHPATGYMRLVYLTDAVGAGLEQDLLARWEVYVLDNQRAARMQWRAPVSPYFYVIDPDGRIIQKGVGSRSNHLDRLLSLRPGTLARATPPEAAREGVPSV